MRCSHILFVFCWYLWQSITLALQKALYFYIHCLQNWWWSIRMSQRVVLPWFSTVTMMLLWWFLQRWQLSFWLKQRIPIITSTSTSRTGKFVEGGPNVRGQSCINAGAQWLGWHESRCIVFPQHMKPSHENNHWCPTEHETRAWKSVTALFPHKWNQVTYSNECGMCLILSKAKGKILRLDY